MAEEVTLARLVVDSGGVTKGVTEMGNALLEGASVVQGFGVTSKKASEGAASLVGRLFDMRQAFVTFAGAVGVVGIASIVATLTRNLVANSEAWKAATAAVGDFFRALVLGEGDIDRTARKLKEFQEQAGIIIPQEKLRAQQVALQEAIEKNEALRISIVRQIAKQEAIDDTMGKVTKRTVLISTQFGLFRQIVSDTTGPISILTLKLQDARTEFRELQRQLTEATTKLASMKEPASAVTDEIGALQRRLAATKIETIAYSEATVGLVGLAELTNPFFARFDFQLDKQINRWRDLNDAVRGYSLILKTLPELLPPVTNEVLKSLDKQLTAWSALTIGMQSAGAAVAQAFLEAGTSTKDLFVQVMKDLSRAMIIKGFEYTAYALASATGIGAGTLGGTTTQFAAAAAKFFAVGALAGAGARAGGSASGAGAGEPLGGPFAGPSAVTAPVQNIQVIVEGSLLGTTPEQLGRDLADLVNRGVRDGITLDGQV